MTIHLNPVANAEVEIRYLLKSPVPPTAEALMSVVRRAISAEKMMMGQHEQCGANNPEGKADLCQCYCHKGHYRHAWQPVIKTPVLNPDGTYHLMDRCKYCPDIRLKIIKATWKDEKHQLVSLEYHVRGEQRVLTKEEWLSRTPEPMPAELKREAGL